MFHVWKGWGMFLRQVNGGPNQPTMMDVLQAIQHTNEANAVRLANVEKWQADHDTYGHPQPRMDIGRGFTRKKT